MSNPNIPQADAERACNRLTKRQQVYAINDAIVRSFTTTDSATIKYQRSRDVVRLIQLIVDTIPSPSKLKCIQLKKHGLQNSQLIFHT